MKIIIYSDLHLEFGHSWLPPQPLDGDVMILAGDIMTLKDYSWLRRLLHDWNRPVLYVCGNHEYYTSVRMDEENENFRLWLSKNYPNVTLLLDEETTIGGVQFFGGTMWTDFNEGDPLAMETARQQMNDFRLIRNASGGKLTPADTIKLHTNFVEKLTAWFEKDLQGPRVVVSHHAPVINPNTQYKNSPLMPAFNSLDMQTIMEKYQPALWVYGHTHECDDQMVGETRIISNQLGYPRSPRGFECAGFDPYGRPVEV